MNEDIRKHLAALNAAWQRYARAREQQRAGVEQSARGPFPPPWRVG